eukprot:6176842-Pleurochrysis_carterae.AAC.4
MQRALRVRPNEREPFDTGRAATLLKCIQRSATRATYACYSWLRRSRARACRRSRRSAQAPERQQANARICEECCDHCSVLCRNGAKSCPVQCRRRPGQISEGHYHRTSHKSKCTESFLPKPGHIVK